MKGKRKIKNKIKKVNKERLNLSGEAGGVFMYLLGYVRALEWILRDDKG